MGALHWEFRSDEDLSERVMGRAKTANGHLCVCAIALDSPAHVSS